MSNYVFFTQANRVFGADGLPLSGARAYFFESETTTPVSVFADAALTVELSQPVIASSAGVFRPVYIGGSAALRVLLTAPNDVPEPGYPRDNIVPLAAELSGAGLIPFTPQGPITATNVQDAVTQAAEVAQDQSSVLIRAFTAWTTGGTGDAFAITPSPAINGYGEWQMFLVRPNRANAGAVTLNVNGLGARNLRRTNSAGVAVALTAGEIQPGEEFLALYDGTQFTMVADRSRHGTITGANNNGSFWQRADGFQECFIAGVQFAFLSANVLQAPWTFPRAFAASPFIDVMLPSGGVDYSGIDVSHAGIVRVLAAATTSTIFLTRVFGAPDFVAGDTVSNVRLSARGRYI